MNGRFSAQDHDRLSPSIQRSASRGGQPQEIQRLPRGWVPTLSASDAERAPQVTTAESDRECRNQFQFIRNLRLSRKNARAGTGVTNPISAHRPVNTAGMGAKAAVLQR